MSQGQTLRRVLSGSTRSSQSSELRTLMGPTAFARIVTVYDLDLGPSLLDEE